MSSADLASTAQSKASVAGAEVLGFLCPCCHQRLNVPATFAGIAGPCPACAEVIRAPVPELVHPKVTGNQEVTAGHAALPAVDQDHGENHDQAPRGRPGGSGFNAVLKIESLSADDLDDSWRERHQRGRKQSRRRRRRTRIVRDLLGSNAAERTQKVCMVVIGAILIITVVGIYFNHRSGGRLFEKLFGI